MRSLIALLALAACAEAPDDTLDALPADAAGPPVVLDASFPILGGKLTFEVSGANANETVYVLRSMSGQGAGDCFPQIGNQCLDIRSPATFMTSFTTDGAGLGDKQLNVPNIPSIDGDTVCFQGAVIRGAGGANSVKTNVVCRELGYDADDDGIIDSRDACPGFDDYYDWDMDGVADGCDAPADRPPVYPNADPLLPLSTDTYQGRRVRWVIPPNPTGLAFFFHGTGGDHTIVDTPEAIVLINELLQRGIGVAAFESDNRTQKVWTTAGNPSQNADFQRLADWRQQRISQGDIAANTTIYGWGFSNGGSMVSYMSHATTASGWDWGAGALQGSRGNSDRYGAPANAPMIFMAGRWDTDVIPADIQGDYQDHINFGFPGRYWLIPEQRLAPTRFDRSDLVNRNQSETMFKLVVDEGFFDKGGNRLFPSAQIEPVVNTIGNLADFYPSRPGKGVLNAVLATHAINGYFAAEMAEYFDRFN